mgnify:CR=1 FL=1
MEEKHFFVVHTFVSDEARKEYLTPPEKKNPPEKRSTEKEWVDGLHGKYAKCMQTWIGNEEFFYCHWIAKSERDVYRQLEEFGLEGKIVNSMVQEIHQFVSCLLYTSPSPRDS